MMGALQVDSLSVTCLQGDALTVLRTLSDEQFHCCVTSPPYWGLRDYGTAKWDGGDPNCEHSGVEWRCDKEGTNDRQTRNKGAISVVSRNCLKCGATRVDFQIGLESTPEEYVANLVDIFREVWRVLRKDGTLWLNIGDSYTSGGRSCFGPGGTGWKHAHTVMKEVKRLPQPYGLKPKDLVGIPWRVAFALQADGWYLRSDVIWAKPNPMPESVADRPTKAHEYLFLLAKSERYYYDAEAIAEPVTCFRIRGPAEHPDKVSTNGNSGLCRANYRFGRVPQVSANRKDLHGPTYSRHRSSIPGGQSLQATPDGFRNKRSVWTIQTQPYPEAHFATFPEDLVRPCILAGCPHGGAVLDPFAGSGTTLMVAKELHCSGVGIELNPAYVVLVQDRIAQEVLPFAAALDDTLPEEEVTPLPPEPEQLTFDLEVA